MSGGSRDPAKWRRMALAVCAGLASLAVCSGVMAAIFLFVAGLVLQSLTLGTLGSASHPFLYLVGAVLAVLVASASLSLPPRALGARGRHALITTLLSSLCYCFFAFTFFLSTPVALAALVATTTVGSLGVILEGNSIASRPLWATMIAGATIYCASLLAFWSVPGDVSDRVLAGIAVAGLSWFVLPGIVAMLRSG